MIINNFSNDLTGTYGTACAALARAQERVALCPERQILLTRLRVLEQEALGFLEGETIIPDHLALEYGYSPRSWRRWPYVFAQIFDKPLPAGTPPGAAALNLWIEDDAIAAEKTATGTMTRLPIEPIGERLAMWEQRSRTSWSLPSLIAAGDAAAAFLRISPLNRGNLVVGIMLGDRLCQAEMGFSAGGIAAIGLMRRQIPWLRLVTGEAEEYADDLSSAAHSERRRLGWLAALTEGALAVIDLDQRLRLWLQTLEAACDGRRRSSHLRELAEFAAINPSVTTSRVSAHLGLSRQGAIKLLEEASQRRILREITQGNAFRRYVATI